MACNTWRTEIEVPLKRYIISCQDAVPQKQFQSQVFKLEQA